MAGACKLQQCFAPQVAQRATRKQKIRKARKQERGASAADKRAVKSERDTLKLERRLRNKALW
eukprot:scaffold51374_cov30-Tisochrysis_lutea.AAC.4